MLRRALANIIENVIKYNVMEGSIGITVWEEPHKSIIRVIDTGIGVSKEAVEIIFEPFYRFDTSRSRKIAEAGFGLAIARDTIKRHGGDIIFRQSNMAAAALP